uniref:pleckstrin homology domain-containing family B member 2-like n=1 Tax=Styela clava TaxID=7725 RepID=UPI001939E368|nr:pleckstrin homology domain-containing family B member 2-like [Styela clava]
MATPIVKCGWLLRLSTVLKRWKKNYFVLLADGNLSYYEDETKREKHGNVNLLFNGASIKTALECAVEPPEGRVFGCLMTIVCLDKEEITVCSETNDECLAWKLMVEQPIEARARGYQPGRPQQGAAVPQYAPQQRYPYPAGQQPYPAATQGAAPYPQQQAPVYYYPNHGPVQVLYTTQGRPYYVHPRTQVIHVIRDDDPYYYRGSGMMYGVAAGAMLGAAMWTPFLFF